MLYTLLMIGIAESSLLFAAFTVLESRRLARVARLAERIR